MTRRIVLSKDQRQLAETLIGSGRFNTVDEVVGVGLRLVAAHQPTDEEKLSALRAALQIGFDDIEHGRCVTFDSAEDLRAHLEKLLSGANDTE